MRVVGDQFRQSSSARLDRRTGLVRLGHGDHLGFDLDRVRGVVLDLVATAVVLVVLAELDLADLEGERGRAVGRLLRLLQLVEEEPVTIVHAAQRALVRDLAPVHPGQTLVGVRGTPALSHVVPEHEALVVFQVVGQRGLGHGLVLVHGQLALERGQSGLEQLAHGRPGGHSRIRPDHRVRTLVGLERAGLLDGEVELLLLGHDRDLPEAHLAGLADGEHPEVVDREGGVQVALRRAAVDPDVDPVHAMVRASRVGRGNHLLADHVLVTVHVAGEDLRARVDVGRDNGGALVGDAGELAVAAARAQDSSTEVDFHGHAGNDLFETHGSSSMCPGDETPRLFESLLFVQVRG